MTAVCKTVFMSSQNTGRKLHDSPCLLGMMLFLHTVKSCLGTIPSPVEWLVATCRVPALWSEDSGQTYPALLTGCLTPTSQDDSLALSASQNESQILERTQTVVKMCPITLLKLDLHWCVWWRLTKCEHWWWGGGTIRRSWSRVGWYWWRGRLCCGKNVLPF